MVEARHLVDLGHRQAHLLGKRREMRSRQVAVRVLDFVKMLDEQVATARRIAQQLANLLQRPRNDPATLGRAPLRSRDLC